MLDYHVARRKRGDKKGAQRMIEILKFFLVACLGFALIIIINQFLLVLVDRAVFRSANEWLKKKDNEE